MNYSDITVLLIEDDPIAKKLMLNVLSRYNFKDIYSAIEGKDDMQNYKYYLPDIVFTNYTLPTSNGLDISKKIKEYDSDVPIILITNKHDTSTIVEAINIGIDGYLFKPLDLNKLDALIKKHVKRVILQKSFKKEHNFLQEYKSAIDLSSAITKSNPDGVITFSNDLYYEMSGYSASELIGKNHNILRHPDTKLQVYKDMWGTIKNKKIWRGHIANLNKAGDTYYESSVIIPILNEHGDIYEYLCFREDVTDLYEQEQFLKKRIEQEIDKNTALHQKREEEKLAEAKFSIIGRMSAGITHEINTPLTYAKGNLELMVQDIDSLDDELKQKEYLKDDVKTVLDGINRIAYIVESMKEMTSKTKELPQVKNVYACLITALTLSHNKSKFTSKIMIQNKLFELGMDKDEYIFEAQIQSQRIEQVFVIIINNAVDALVHIDDFESRLIEISIADEDDGILITFKDNGDGINEEILPKIFDPFESTKEEGGIGIGLNVAKKIIDEHHGKIIASNHDNGAQFEVFIPKVNLGQ